MELDLAAHQFSNAETLILVPGLSQGTLQNWVARGVFDYLPDDLDAEDSLGPSKPEKHKKAYWSAFSIIALRFMVAASEYGIAPSESIALAYDIILELDTFLERFKSKTASNGCREFFIDGDQAKDFRVAKITRTPDGTFSVATYRRDMTLSFLFGSVGAPISILVEIDLLFLMALNGILRLKQGRDPLTGELQEK
jgi:hypothetical protein